jgi:hypothetical protein
MKNQKLIPIIALAIGIASGSCFFSSCKSEEGANVEHTQPGTAPVPGTNPNDTISNGRHAPADNDGTRDQGGAIQKGDTIK